MVYLTSTPSVQSAPAPAETDINPNSKSTIDTALGAALEHARRLTQMFGTDATEVAIAWETVEELQHARVHGAHSHLVASVTLRAAFLRYCEENPNAPEARIYDS